MRTIDINCDLGESYGAWRMGDDEGVMPHITSANVACGFHGGDPATIRRTVRLATEHGVAVGAHPSLPDLMGFGRRPMKITPDEAYDLVLYQAGAVQAFARAAGTRLAHVQCHGAFYNMAATDDALSDAIARAVRDLGDGVILYALSGSRMMAAGQRLGVRTLAEVFADRGYQDDGTLTPRTQKGAMIEDEAAAVAQAVGMVERGTVTSLAGRTVPVDAGTICLHGDQPGAVAFAKALRAAFRQRGIRVAAP
ncbi:MAG: LamB/YcsF family protein [Burkholderiales bacterium]|nr:LamB/YcsF family protein [Burkholderiales bacterium]